MSEVRQNEKIFSTNLNSNRLNFQIRDIHLNTRTAPYKPGGNGNILA